MAKSTETKEEIKFCKNCGKKLVGDEKCDCVKEVKTTSSNGFDIAAILGSIKDDLVNCVKKPIDVIEENAKAQDMNKACSLLVIISLTFGLFISACIKPIISYVMGLMAGSYGSLASLVTDAIKINYVKIILVYTIVYIIAMAIYAGVMLVIPAIIKNKKVSYKEAIGLTSGAYLPMIAVNIVCAILGFLSVTFSVIAVLYIVASLIVAYNFGYGYAKYTEVEINKFGYAIAILVVLAGMVSGFISYKVTENTMTDAMTTDIEDLEDLDLDDLGL